MKLRALKWHARNHPVDLKLFSTEGDIYVLQINGWDWLADKSGKTLMVFHSLSEAKEHLGEKLSHQMQLEQSGAYDEMIISRKNQPPGL